MKTKKLALLGLLLAYAMILSYIESLIPFFGGVPGMKLGLPNMAIVYLIYSYGNKEGAVVNLLRIVLTGFLFGSMFGILFSIAGAVISFIVMCVVKKTDIFDVRGVSICGGVAHNIGQLLIAAFVVKTSGIIYYLPLLLISGALCGFLNGLIADYMLKYSKIL
ncbi:Gx transporter family protein [Butyrivibrio sp. INlla16]|uniref:Gx transporter family protein n=1 Tax=Butyrivibrio sp. INlla16 TaxID=1520807 RepID=UPI00088ED633|nr:Gx transporter family protein [Butyrivibrio sp. INlla16]SDB16823.1 heptaprenyl diphosphate synthase [Butyrivibrio sp. INlla16]